MYCFTSFSCSTDEADNSSIDEVEERVETATEETNIPETNNEEEETVDNNTENNEISYLATYGENYMAFEAEDTDSPLDQWNLITENDEGYLDKEGIAELNEAIYRPNWDCLLTK